MSDLGMNDGTDYSNLVYDQNSTVENAKVDGGKAKRRSKAGSKKKGKSRSRSRSRSKSRKNK